jgi:hypothetical protein
MFRKLYGWLYGWKETLAIEYREPDLYRELTRPVSFPGDFGEVRPPE